MIVNTIKSDKYGTHWRSILQEYFTLTSKRQILPFDSLSFTGLESFICLELKYFKKADKTTTLATKFSAYKYKRLNSKELANLSTTDRNLLRFISEFGKLRDIQDKTTVYFIDGQLQSIETDTCGIFELFL